MKHIQNIVLTISAICGIVAIHCIVHEFQRVKHEYYQKGIIDGSMYVLTFKEGPSGIEQKQMNRIIDSNWSRDMSTVYHTWRNSNGKHDSTFHPQPDNK